MDKTALTQGQVLDIVRAYKDFIRPRFRSEPRVMLYGSYSKGAATPDSDIDVAVIVPNGEVVNWWEQSADLWSDIQKVNVLIEPVLLEEEENSTLYHDVMSSGIAV